MRRQKNLILLCGILLVSFGLAGCKLVREVDLAEMNMGENEVEPNQSEFAEVIGVTDGKVIDENALCEYFYGLKREDLISAGYLVEENLDPEEFGYECYLGFTCKKDDIELLYKPTYNTEVGWGRNSFTMRYCKDGAADCYYSTYNLRYTLNEISSRFMEVFPQEELKSCSMAEAIEICRPLAEACGYEDAEVKVYAMTVDALKQASTIDGMCIVSAPNPDSSFWDSEEMIEWSENNEAYVLIYQYPLNGLLLDSVYYQMMCIYVPAYNRIVYAHAEQRLVVEDILEKKELVTKKEALSEAIRVLKVSEEQIEITNISLVYSPRFSTVDMNNERRTIEPCWRIDYILSEELLELPVRYSDDGTILINALDGRENTYNY